MKCKDCKKHCVLHMEYKDGVLIVTGNKCKKGLDYAKKHSKHKQKSMLDITSFDDAILKNSITTTYKEDDVYVYLKITSSLRKKLKDIKSIEYVIDEIKYQGNLLSKKKQKKIRSEKKLSKKIIIIKKRAKNE